METLRLTKDELTQAANLIHAGEVVAMPTETVYGLAANAFDENAVAKIFKAKGRPQDNPLIVHISSLEMLDNLVEDIPDIAYELIENFWPGALTLIFNKSKKVPNCISKGLDTVAVRFPAHKTALEFISLCKTPLAAPSANTSGRPSTTSYKHVLDDLDGKISAVIIDEDAEIGLESTVVDITKKIPVLLRPGSITPKMLSYIIGEILIDDAVFKNIDNTKKVNSPGMKYKHYAPKAEVFVICGDPNKTAEFIKQNCTQTDGILCFDEFSFSNDIVLKLGSFNDLHTQARNLFAKLREFDDTDVKKIYAQCTNDENFGLAISNRLKKSSGFNVIEV